MTIPSLFTEKVTCAICRGEVSTGEVLRSEWWNADAQRWDRMDVCPGCADPADVLIDRLIREETQAR